MCSIPLLCRRPNHSCNWDRDCAHYIPSLVLPRPNFRLLLIERAKSDWCQRL